MIKLAPYLRSSRNNVPVSAGEMAGKQAEAVRPLIERYRLGGCYLSQDNAASFAEARQLTGELERISQAVGDAVPLLLGWIRRAPGAC